MSAAETERVEVDVAPSDYVEADADPDPDAGGSASTSSATSTRRGFLEMLTATTPRERPTEQDGTFSTSAKWHQHLELAMKKATGSEGTPAWANLTMSALLLFAESAGIAPDADADADADAEQDDADPDSVTRDRADAPRDPPAESRDVQDSRRPPTAENGETNILGGE